MGLLTGNLLGLFARSVGLAVAVGADTLGGLMCDLVPVGVNHSFLDEASRQLEPGKVAVVAEAWEEGVTPVNTPIGEVDGIALRRVRREVIEAQIDRDVKTLRTELASLRDEQSRVLRRDTGNFELANVVWRSWTEHCSLSPLMQPTTGQFDSRTKPIA